MNGKICFGGSENLALGGHLGLEMCQDGAKIMPTWRCVEDGSCLRLSYAKRCLSKQKYWPHNRGHKKHDLKYLYSITLLVSKKGHVISERNLAPAVFESETRKPGFWCHQYINRVSEVINLSTTFSKNCQFETIPHGKWPQKRRRSHYNTPGTISYSSSISFDK